MLQLKIVEVDLKRGILVVHIENVDDLYVLTSFIKGGDLVKARTSRRLKIREGESVRKTMTLTLEVDKISFHEFGERIRIHGIIREGPEKFVSLGSYHTINVKIGDTITIIRPDGLTEEELEPIREAEKLSEHKPILLLAIEEGEATIGILTSYGLKIYSNIRRNVSSKDNPKEYDSLLKAFFSEIIGIINELINQYDPIALIIAGPGFTKEHFKNYIERKLNKPLNIVVDNVTSGTEAGIYEIIRRGTPDKVLQEQRVSKETALVQEVIMHLSKKDNLVVYGLDEVEKAVSYGIVRTLLISMDLLKTPEEEKREKILKLIKLAKSFRSEVHLISTLHPTGKQFLSLGGIAAILRYPIKK